MAELICLDIETDVSYIIINKYIIPLRRPLTCAFEPIWNCLDFNAESTSEKNFIWTEKKYSASYSELLLISKPSFLCIK